MRCVVIWAVSAVAVVGVGCIESQRVTLPPNDTRTSEPDTSSEIDADDARDALDPHDGLVDTRVEPEDTDVGPEDTTSGDGDDALGPDTLDVECERPADCQLPLGPCEVATCDDHTCGAIAGREGLACDDGDACTRDTACDAGVCKGGQPITCPEPAGPCFTATCGSATGCSEQPAPSGTACDNGSGPAVGACALQGWALADSCDAVGQCLDRFDSSGAGTGANTPGGAWYFVASSMGPDASGLLTARGWMGLESSNAVTLTGVTTSDEASPQGVDPWLAGTGLLAGWYCAAPNGRVDLELGDHQRLRGHHSPTANVLAAASISDGTLLVGVRPQGTVAQVHGEYRFVSTSRTSGELHTWFGSLKFASGCPTGVGVMVTRAGSVFAPSWDIQPKNGDCLEVDDDGRAPFAVDLELRPSGSAGSWTGVRWAGAVASGGEVLVLARDDGDESPRYGTIVMVRQSDLTANPPMAGAYAYLFQGEHAEAGGVVAERGAFAVSPQATVSGWVEAAAPHGVKQLDGDVAARTIRGRYAQVLRTDALARIQSGWINASNSFGFVFSASFATTDFDAIGSNVPVAPSLGFVIGVVGNNLPAP